MNETRICGVDLEDFLIQMEEFHGGRSPGLLLGGMMLETGLEELGPTAHLNVVTETVVCLPDAVQLLTPCTLGNGFLQTLDWGKFALTTYDRKNLSGVRVWIKGDSLDSSPPILQWFDRSSRTGPKPSFEELLPEILTTGRSLVAKCKVRLHHPLKDSGSVPTAPCPGCGEFYPVRLGPACPACSGKAYYRLD